MSLGDGIPPSWATIGLDGAPNPAFAGKPEFFFFCPNHRSTSEFLFERLDRIATRGYYKGIFFDRIRFPSPTEDPVARLGCFCPECYNLATEADLDLETVRRYILMLPAEAFVRSLLASPDDPSSPLESFLDFRQESITRTVQAAAQQASSLDFSVGLDCFSPILTRMTGQNLPALNKTCDWIKIMTYPRVQGPAGLPFELLGLANWMTKRGVSEQSAMQSLAKASGLIIPTTIAELQKTGLELGAISHELESGHRLGVTNLLAGIALIEISGVNEFNNGTGA